MNLRKPRAQSATSLGPAPDDDATSRIRTYLITMGIRMGCFVLAGVITPYGWHTALFAAGAVFLPYIAVTVASVGHRAKIAAAERPDARTLAPSPPPVAHGGVIRITESSPQDPV